MISIQLKTPSEHIKLGFKNQQAVNSGEDGMRWATTAKSHSEFYAYFEKNETQIDNASTHRLRRNISDNKKQPPMLTSTSCVSHCLHQVPDATIGDAREWLRDYRGLFSFNMFFL